MAILDKVNESSDLKKLNIKELEQLSKELRDKIIDTTRKNGGHLSSNLGVIESTVALHYVFDIPKDKIVFDVGHQCYAHKILSGRKDKFDSIRLIDGISGFPNRDESESDAFTSGHAGTSISAGLGICNARDKLNEDYNVICFVGDGSIVNGLNLEAITSSNVKPKKFLVVLNDNGMSISHNVNGLYQIISKNTAKHGYIKSKRAFKKVFRESFITKIFRKFKNFVKRMVSKGFPFDGMGFKYVGVVPGNDVKELVKILSRVKNTLKYRSVLLHVKTTKGKGFEDAEEHSDAYHGVGKNFDLSNGDFSSRAGQKLCSVIDNDKNVVAIVAGMKDGTGLKVVEEKHKENFYDVGIAEEHAVTLAAGMAVGGLKPVVAIYSTFLQRAYDQVLHDVCIQNLPVVFLLDRAGFSGADGVTHQGLFDLSYLSHLPNMTVIAPSSLEELDDAIDYALKLNSPVAIRYPKNCIDDRKLEVPIKSSLWETVDEGSDVSILAVGPKMIDLAKNVRAKTEKSVAIINARVVKPLDEKVLDKISNTTVITLEENSVLGGFGSSVTDYYSKTRYNTRVVKFGAPDKFMEHGSVTCQFEKAGLTVENILKSI